MRILLPPSEGKTAGRRGRPYDPGALAFPDLAAMRRTVAEALAAVSAQDDATSVLGVGAGVAHEIDRNTVLDRAPALAARDTYTGVLFDALDLATLDAASKRRASLWVLIFSALYGVVRPGDRIAAYRLGMGVDLPGVGPLAPAWRPHLDRVLDREMRRGLIVDCRSAAYVAAWTPRGDEADRWIQVRVPGASHMAKHTRGLVARAILTGGLDPGEPIDLADALAGIFDDVSLTPPARKGRAWSLDVVASAAG